MITLRPAAKRQHHQRDNQEMWLTFYPQDRGAPFARGFGTLQVLMEGRLAPKAGAEQPRHDAEIITYVHEGTLAYEDSLGQARLIRAGEFQCVTAGRGIRYSEMNASPTDDAHVFHIWLRPSAADLEPGHEHQRFSAASCPGRPRVVASPDAREGSMKIHQDAVLYSVVLEPNMAFSHQLGENRGAWLQVVDGEVQLGAQVLVTGDGVGITAERVISIMAAKQTELLLLEIGQI